MMTYEDAKRKIKEYQQMPFTTYIHSGLKKVEKNLDIYVQDREDSMKCWGLEQAIWDLTIEMKAEVVTGELNRNTSEELKEFLWDLLQC